MSEKDINKQLPKFHNLNSRIQRVLSMLLDHLIMCLVVVPIGIIIFIFISRFEEYLNKTAGVLLISIPMFIYFNKDFFRGKSLGKRIVGFQIIDRKTNEPANEFQCFVRNLTIIFWPLEVLVGIISPERRIGDLLANTKVVPSEKENVKSILSDLKSIKFRTNFLAILVLAIIYFYCLSELLIFNRMDI